MTTDQMLDEIRDQIHYLRKLQKQSPDKLSQHTAIADYCDHVKRVFGCYHRIVDLVDRLDYDLSEGEKLPKAWSKKSDSAQPCVECGQLSESGLCDDCRDQHAVLMSNILSALPSK